MLILDNVCFSYEDKNSKVDIIKECSFEFYKGQFYAIRARSGSGKTTFLNLVGLMQKISLGDYSIEGKNMKNSSDKFLSSIRAKYFGFLFQNYRLIGDETVYRNIEISLEIAGHKNKNENQKKIEEIMSELGLIDKMKSYPSQLSGGESQRVAFARAIAKKPSFLIADEPTGNLDIENRDIILGLIQKFCQENGGVIMVTHDLAAAAWATDSLILENGRLVRAKVV